MQGLALLLRPSRQPILQKERTLTGHEERNILDHIVERVGGYRREVVVNYYIALKTKRFVILAGPGDLDKMSLARGLAEVVAGQPSLQWSLLQAHPWWVTGTGAPGDFAMAHARFSNLKLLDVIEGALASEAAGLPLAFFVGVERMSPAEVLCYFCDLPNDRLWRADGSILYIRIPRNIYITGTLDVEEKCGIMSTTRGEHGPGITIQLRHEDVAPSVGAGRRVEPRPDWQARFVRSAVRSGDQARAKLAQIFPDDCAPLAPLDELERRLGVQSFPPNVYEDAWLYLANAFDVDGHGLFVEPALENVSIAQDYVLVQSVLPHVITGRLESSRVRSDEVKEYLRPRFPRAYAWIERLSRRNLNVPARRRAQSGSTNAEVGLGPAAARQTAN